MVVVFALCCWLQLMLQSSGEAELSGLHDIKLFGVRAEWQRADRQASAPASSAELAAACDSTPPVLLLLLLVRSGAEVRRGCRRRALLLTASVWKADVAVKPGRVQGLPVAASACLPHRLDALTHAPSLHLVPHHVGPCWCARDYMLHTCTCTCARACAHACACTCTYTCSYAGT